MVVKRITPLLFTHLFLHLSIMLFTAFVVKCMFQVAINLTNPQRVYK